MRARLTAAAIAAVALIAATAGAKTKLPAVERLQLPNGLTVMLIEDHGVPLVSVSFRARTGSLVDPEGKEGTAELAAEMLMYGTTKRTEQQIDDALERLGATLETGAGKEGVYASGSVPTVEPGARDTLLDIVADVLLHPTFPADAFERVRTRQLGFLQTLVDDRGAVADRAFQMLLFKGHPYGRFTSGTMASVKAIQQADLVRFHKTFVVPEEAVLGIAGDFDRKALVPLLKKLFGDPAWGQVCPEGGRCQRACQRAKGQARCQSYLLPSGQTVANPLLAIPPAEDPKGAEVVLVDTGDPTLNQAQIRLGAPLQRTYGQPGWHAHYLAAQILGGDFTARMNTLLRVKAGLTYGARWSVDYDDVRSGASQLSTYTSPKDVTRAVHMALDALKTFETEPIPPAELLGVQERLVNSFVFRFETARSTLSEYLNLWQDLLPKSFLEDMTDKLKAVTAADVEKVVGEFPSSDFLLVVVGNAALRDDLEGLAKDLKGTFSVVTPADIGLGTTPAE